MFLAAKFQKSEASWKWGKILVAGVWYFTLVVRRFAAIISLHLLVLFLGKILACVYVWEALTVVLEM